MAFYDFIPGPILQKSKLLTPTHGLPAIFSPATLPPYPWDIRADAETLYTRWLHGPTDPHLLRGILSGRRTTPGTTKRTTTHRLDASYPARRTCDHVGAGDLRNGDWWPLRCRSRRCATARTAGARPASTARRGRARFPWC